MSTGLRLLTVKLLRKLGVKHFRAQSGINQPFICHLGDSNGENPFYNFASSRMEIVIMATWCRQFEGPSMLDVGGNVGFVATQIAQLIRTSRPRIFSFEPVPVTFQRLLNSIRLLELDEFIHPVCSALSDVPTLTRITYSEWDTMFAQVTPDASNQRVGDKTAWCPALTVDEVGAVIGRSLALIKIDVEGHEVKVLKGAARILSGEDAPGLCLEFNPLTLAECQASAGELASLLSGYDLFYVDDFEGQRMSFGQPISELASIDWVCNIFAVPPTSLGRKRWTAAINEAEALLSTLRA